MNKVNLIDSIAEQADLTKKQATDALDVLTLTTANALSVSVFKSTRLCCVIPLN